MSYLEITYDVTERIATITLSRPDRMNALTPLMLKELHEALDQADADRGVKVVILTGAGPAFSAGFDQGAKPASAQPSAEATMSAHSSSRE